MSIHFRLRSYSDCQLNLTHHMKINIRLAAALVAGVVVSAKADIVPIGLLWTPGLPFSEIDYEAGLSLGQQLKSGDHFMILDIDSLVSISPALPPGWTSTVQNVSVQPLGISTFDNPAEPNVLFTYSGPDLNGPVSLGFFDVFVTPDTDLNFTFNNNWIGTAHKIPILGGEVTANITSVPIPTVAVPESSTVGAAIGLMAATGFVSRSKLRKLRRQRQKA